MTTYLKKIFSYGKHTVTVETGLIANQATAAVWVNVDDTVVLVTVVATSKHTNHDSDADFLPLTVHYQERDYAVGRVPGGYFKRESRPSEYATIISRLIDRAIRPLFPKRFNTEMQVTATVLSMHPHIDPSIPALIGTSFALALSGLPIKAYLASARIGRSEEQFILNPTVPELAVSSLDMVVAGTEQAVIMVEAKAIELPETLMQEAVFYAHTEMQAVITAIKNMVAEANVTPWPWTPPVIQTTLANKVQTLAHDKLISAYQLTDKQTRHDTIGTIRTEITHAILAEVPLLDQVNDAENQVHEETPVTQKTVHHILDVLQRNIVRGRILQGLPRIDGRDHQTVRPISIQVGLLPHTHGSALFTRGETQALVIVTLGTERDAQTIDALSGEYKENFLLHYNFPPYSVGEVGMIGTPKRREIGHGYLAKRSFAAVLPSIKDFAYVIRVVSEITASNGSSSMATVCGTSLALMDAGVPLSTPVAGIAMGLVKDHEHYVILTDILGDEDHLGDMDFKVAGTAQGITALQMDIKTDGITQTIMQRALAQAREGRLHILAEMHQALSAPRQDISVHAPRILTTQIPPDKIRTVIGKGGVTIHALTEETGTVIDINDNGEIKVSATSLAACEEAIRRIEYLTADVIVGQVYDGKVVQLRDFGALVSILNGKQGLVHISQIANRRIAKVEDALTEGQEVKVKVLEIDKQGRIRLSIKDVEQVTV